jgi:hypothetical protein
MERDAMTIATASLSQLRTDNGTGLQRTLARASTFSVERIKGTAFSFEVGEESFLLLPAVGATISKDGKSYTSPKHAVAIVNAGRYEVKLDGEGEAFVLAVSRPDLDLASAINTDYGAPNPLVAPLGAPFKSLDAGEDVRIHTVESIVIPPDNGRLRFLQTATMSINWVEYTGLRSRNALSPHAHDDFEQCSLAIEGDFLHHLRVPWGPDADQWRDDVHLAAGPGTLMVVPPRLIHTTEGVGDGLHILIDIFAPPRRDFIAKNWVHNAAQYVTPEAVTA